MHFSEEAVFQHLEDFLIETDTILQQQNKTHELELCLMLIQCIEVKIRNDFRSLLNCNWYLQIWCKPMQLWICFQDSLTEQFNHLHQDNEKEATFVKTLLSTSIEILQSCSTVMERIRSVATARFCLQIIAKHLRECYSLNPISKSDVYEERFRMAAVLCDLPIKHIR